MPFNKENFQHSGLKPLIKEPARKNQSRSAAVLVPLVQLPEQFSLLLTRRSSNMTHHGGEVAFPGGMWEQGDSFPIDTALREAEEEVAIRSADVNLLGLLPSLATRNGTEVTPVVGLIPPNLHLVPSPSEIDSIFLVPLSEFVSEKRIRTDIFQRFGENLWTPAYEFEGHQIWGFTAGVIKMLLERCFQLEFHRQYHAPEKIW